MFHSVRVHDLWVSIWSNLRMDFLLSVFMIDLFLKPRTFTSWQEYIDMAIESKSSHYLKKKVSLIFYCRILPNALNQAFDNFLFFECLTVLQNKAHFKEIRVCILNYSHGLFITLRGLETSKLILFKDAKKTNNLIKSTHK